MKKYLIPGIILLLIIFASFFYMNTETADIRNNISIQTKNINEKDEMKRFAIHVVYPEIQGSPRSGMINGVFKSFAESRIEEFKRSLEDSVPVFNERSFLLQYATSVPAVAPNVLGVYFVEEFDLGGAHPGHAITTFHYDLKSGKEISLQDIFTEKDFVGELSDIAIKALTEKLGTFATEEQITEGAGRDLENFQSFVITNGGLRILFNEYKVAAYSAGVQEVLIPWTEISRSINPEVILIEK